MNANKPKTNKDTPKCKQNVQEKNKESNQILLELTTQLNKKYCYIKNQNKKEKKEKKTHHTLEMEATVVDGNGIET